MDFPTIKLKDCQLVKQCCTGGKTVHPETNSSVVLIDDNGTTLEDWINNIGSSLPTLTITSNIDTFNDSLDFLGFDFLFGDQETLLEVPKIQADNENPYFGWGLAKFDWHYSELVDDGTGKISNIKPIINFYQTLGGPYTTIGYLYGDESYHRYCDIRIPKVIFDVVQEYDNIVFYNNEEQVATITADDILNIINASGNSSSVGRSYILDHTVSNNTTTITLLDDNNTDCGHVDITVPDPYIGTGGITVNGNNISHTNSIEPGSTSFRIENGDLKGNQVYWDEQGHVTHIDEISLEIPTSEKVGFKEITNIVPKKVINGYEIAKTVNIHVSDFDQAQLYEGTPQSYPIVKYNDAYYVYIDGQRHLANTPFDVNDTTPIGFSHLKETFGVQAIDYFFVFEYAMDNSDFKYLYVNTKGIYDGNDGHIEIKVYSEDLIDTVNHLDLLNIPRNGPYSRFTLTELNNMLCATTTIKSIYTIDSNTEISLILGNLINNNNIYTNSGETPWWFVEGMVNLDITCYKPQNVQQVPGIGVSSNLSYSTNDTFESPVIYAYESNQQGTTLDPINNGYGMDYYVHGDTGDIIYYQTLAFLGYNNTTNTMIAGELALDGLGPFILHQRRRDIGGNESYLYSIEGLTDVSL